MQNQWRVTFPSSIFYLFFFLTKKTPLGVLFLICIKQTEMTLPEKMFYNKMYSNFFFAETIATRLFPLLVEERSVFRLRHTTGVPVH